VLAVDDIRVNQLILARIIPKILPSQIFLADHGVSAIQLFCSRPFDLILMDIEMPRLTGIEATQFLRKIEAQQNRPRAVIIALCSYRPPFYSFPEGLFDDILEKPLRASSLREVFGKHNFHCIPYGPRN